MGFQVCETKFKCTKEWAWKLAGQQDFHHNEITLDYPIAPQKGIFRFKVTRHVRDYELIKRVCHGTKDHELEARFEDRDGATKELYGFRIAEGENHELFFLSSIQEDGGVFNDSNWPRGENFQTRRFEITPHKLTKNTTYQAIRYNNRYRAGNWKQSGDHTFVINFGFPRKPCAQESSSDESDVEGSVLEPQEARGSVLRQQGVKPNQDDQNASGLELIWIPLLLAVLAIQAAWFSCSTGDDSTNVVANVAQAGGKIMNPVAGAGGNNSGAPTVASPGILSLRSICTGLFLFLAGTSGFAMWKTGALRKFISKDVKKHTVLPIAEKPTVSVPDVEHQLAEQKNIAPAQTKTKTTSPRSGVQTAAAQTETTGKTITAVVLVLVVLVGLGALGLWLFNKGSKSGNKNAELDV